MCSRRELGNPSENILSGYLIVQMVTVKMAPILVPKISPELYPIKKLPFKLFSCFGACLEDSMYGIVSALIRTFLYCLAWGMFYSYFPHSWFFVSWKWLLCTVTWRATASPHLWGWNDWVVSLNEYLSPTVEVSTARTQEAALPLHSVHQTGAPVGPVSGRWEEAVPILAAGHILWVLPCDSQVAKCRFLF